MGYDIPYIRNIKGSDTNELIYETETDSETQSMNSCLSGLRKHGGKGYLGRLG